MTLVMGVDVLAMLTMLVAAYSLIVLTSGSRARLSARIMDVVQVHSSLRSSGTSPNFLITFTSLRPPVEGSRLRLNASAPTYPGF
jgi:hypothetical protein